VTNARAYSRSMTRKIVVPVCLQAFNNNGFGLGGGRPLNSGFGPAGFNNGFNGGLVNPGDKVIKLFTDVSYKFS
jgi:hypothetical protein